jgi:hypothetical protein
VMAHSRPHLAIEIIDHVHIRLLRAASDRAAAPASPINARRASVMSPASSSSVYPGRGCLGIGDVQGPVRWKRVNRCLVPKSQEAAHTYLDDRFRESYHKRWIYLGFRAPI